MKEVLALKETGTDLEKYQEDDFKRVEICKYCRESGKAMTRKYLSSPG